MSFQQPMRVYIEDTDAGGIVYHSQYLNYMERARTEWMRTRGYQHRDAERAGYLLVVASLQIKYLRPAVMDDWLHVSVELQRIGKASVLLQQSVWREQQLLAQAQVKLASIGVDSKQACLLPESLRAELLQSQG